jgi:hypothetical protein
MELFNEIAPMIGMNLAEEGLLKFCWIGFAPFTDCYR